MEHPDIKQPNPARKGRVSRRAWLLLLTLCAVVLAVAFVLLLPAIQARFPAMEGLGQKAALHYRSLGTGDTAALESITVTHNADGETYTLRYRDGQLYLDGVGDDDIVGVNVPTGIPLVYHLDENLKPTNPGGTYLDPEAAAAAIQAVANQGKK